METWTKIAGNGKKVELRIDGRSITIFLDGQNQGTTQTITELTGAVIRPGGMYAKAPRTNAAGEKITHAVHTIMLTGPEASQVLPIWEREKAEEPDRIRERMRAEKRRLEQACPGLEILQAAIDDHDEYGRKFERMMEDESNDGANPPARPASDLAALKAQYPRAAMWIKAQSHEHAANHHKSAAGREARELIEAGGDIDEAAKILENWLPASAMWD